MYGPTKSGSKVASGAVVNDTLNIMAEREKLDAYNKAKELAAEREEALSNVKDRTSLANYYQAYTKDLNRAAANNDLTTYYRDKIITNSISKRLKDTSTPLTAIQDFGSEVKTNVTGAVADFSDALAYTGISATSLNPNVLRRIATKEEGTLKETIENYGWGKNNWHDLVMLTQKYPEDKVIANLYDTVSKQGYKGDPEYFNNVVNYINNLNNQERFERWQQQHTIDEQRARELLDVEESLSYNPIGKFMLDSVGVASYMAPSLALGAGVGATTGLTAARGAASLGSMGLSAAGNAASSALQSGYNWNQAGAYGAVVGLTEVATELIGGEFMNSLIFGKSVSTPVGKAMQKFFENNNITNFGVRAALMGLADVNAEGIEEVISEALDPVYKSIILNDYSGFENYGENLFKAYYESILPTLILGGFSVAQINMSVDKQVKAIENSINKNTQFTPEQKAKMINELETAAKDARIGLGEHYEELKAELVKNLKEKAKDDARARSLYAMQAGMSGLTDQEKSDVFNSFIKQKGLQWNPGTGTVQELLDTNESANLTYKNQTDIDIDAGRIMGSNSNITDIYPVETTNKAKANIINMATKIAQKLGKEQVVLADIKTNNGSMVMGATNVESKNIFINANLNIKDTLAATFHELGHVIAEKHPNVFKAFKKAMEVKYGTKLENILREYNNVVGTYDNLGETLTEDQINYLAEELLGDYAGETMSKQENEKKVEKSTRDLWTNLKDLGNAIQSRYDSNTQRDNTKVSEYNLSGLSYLDMGLLNDTSLENMLFDAMKGKDQVKEATKKTEEIVKKGLRKAEPKTETKTEKTQETKKEEKKPEGVNSKIEQRYAEMKDTAKTPEILRMIAEETGLEYNPLVPVSQRGDNARIQTILTQLRNDGKIQETGTKLSVRKGEGSNEFRKLQEESRRELNTKSWKERSEQNDEDLRQRLSRTFKEELRYRGYSDSNNNGILKFSAKGNNFDMYENVDGQTFHDIFEIVRAYTENGELVDLHSVKEDEHGAGYEDTKNYLSTDGMQGFAITKDGDLISVFNADLGKRGFLRSIESFIKKNAKTLDCYMSPLQDLQKIYSSIFGFKTASIMDFNMEYDHDDIAKNHNKPKVAFMVNTEADVETKHFNKDQYDEAQAYQLSYTKNSKQSSFSMRKTDSQGNILTMQQQEFFKDSKIRDENGNLLVMYHGTNNEFTIFDIKKAGINYSGYSNLGKGFYFTPSKKLAENWSNGGKNNRVVEVYLNLKNPFFMGTGSNEISIKKLEEIIVNDIEKAKGKKIVLSNYEKTHGESLLSILRNDLGYNANKITEILKECGFDGISKMIEGDYEWGEVVAFYPNQIKLVDNTNPTDNPDTRFSQRKTDNNGRPLTNAQIDYFKDSVVRDSEGRLLEVYHGSRGNKFFTFNPRRGLNIDGAYFASNINTAGHWSKGYYRMIDEARYKDYTDKIEKAKTIKDVLKIIKDAHLGVELELNAMFNDEKKGDYYRLEEKWGNDDEPSSSGPFGYSKDGGKTFDIENALGRIKDEALDIVNSAYYGGDKHFVYLNITKPLIVDANKKPYWQIEFEGKKVNTETIASIAKERGYDGVIIRDVLETDYENSLTDDYIIFSSEQAKLIDNENPTKNPDTRFSQRKEDPNIRRLEKATNNLRNEMAKQEDKIEEQKNEIKRLENTGKAMEDTYKRVIRGYIKEINNQLRTGRNTELKLKDKNNKLSTAYKYKVYEGQFNRKANLLGLNMGKEFRDLFVGLRGVGDTIDEAWSTTLLIYTEANRFNTAIKNSLNILNEVRQRKVYNKLPQELKDKIDAYNKFYTKGAEQTDLTFAKRLLNDATIREHLGKIAVTNSVKNQLIENEKNTVSLKEYLDSIEAAEKFEVGLEQLREEIKEFQQRNMEAERAKELKPVRNEILDSVATELGVKERQSLNKFKKNLTNRTMFNSQMTFKTETQALMGGNINTPMMALEKNLQNGEIRKKQAIVDMYSFLNKFLTSTAYKIRGIDKWKAELEKSLSNKSDWVDTGVEVRGKNLRLPRSMIMSLAMHLQNDQNMSHISGAITRVVTDDKGKTTIEFKDGEGVRVPNENLYKKGKIDEAFDRGRTIKLSYEDVQDIVSMLTEEEQAFVDATRKVLNYTSKLINEVSNRIYGYDIATVENYFPIHVWRKGVHKDVLQNSKLDKTGKVDALTYLTSAGWLQDRTTSFAPIYLENMAEVLDRVMNNVATYYGYAEALRDNQIILNSAYKEPISFGDDYEADTLEEAIGYLSSSYLENYRRLTRFIVGAESQKYGKLRGLMAMNTLTFNLGTWLTQPMSFFNTLKYYTGKNFLSGVNPINNHIRLDNKIREYYKDLGIDTGDMNDYELARSFIAMATPNLDYRTLGYKKPELKQLYGKRLTDNIDVHGIEAFDNIAVTAIARMMAWNLSQEPGLEFGSEEYFKRLGAELTQVLVETQPEFSQINRANMFRSANPFMRMLNLFGTPANQMFNNMAQSLLELRYQAREGNSEGFKRAVLNAVKSLTGVIVSATMVGLVRALRDSVRYGDDDDTEFADRWIAQGIIAGLGPTLILDDMAQLLMANAKFGGMNSYDFNTPETTYINGVLNLLDKSAQLFKEDVSGAKKATDIIRAFGTVTPVDTKSLVRVYTALMKVVAPDAYKSYKLQTDSTIYKQWLKHSDTDMATFYKAYTATRPKVLESKYGYHKADKEKNIESNLRESREKALNDVLDNSNDVKKYMGILFNYKD